MILPDPWEILEAFSLALDLSGGRRLDHAQKTCLLSMKLAGLMGFSEKEKGHVYIRSLLHDLSTLKPSPDPPLMKIAGRLVEPDPSLLPSEQTSPSLDEFITGTIPIPDSPGSPNSIGRLVAFASQVEIRVSEGKEGHEEVLKTSRKWPKSSGEVAIWEAFRALVEDEGFWTSLNPENLHECLKKTRPVSLTLTQEGYNGFIQSMTDLIDSKSYFTARHSQRVSRLAMHLSVRLDMDKESVEEMRLAGLFHDLGKLAVPHKILDKPGALTAMEYDAVKKHAYYTQAILERIGGFAGISLLAGSHHERLDGKGYHRRLRGTQVSLGSRILAAVDAYDALTSIRPYRYGLTPEKALHVVGEEAGGHFDPNVLGALRECVLK